MVINNFRNKFKDAVNILKIFNEHGFEAYFVGGCVRDYLLGESFSDIDITTNALPSEVKKIFHKTIDTGIQHGTVTILINNVGYEVTTFRTEGDYKNHRAPEKVEFVSNLREDLDRRDFTINAMALDYNGKLFDYHNGEIDLNSKIIRTVNNPNERFYEDALRMLRAFRFSSKLGFDIENETLAAIKKNAQLISYVSIERIVNEFRKLLAGKGNLKSFELLLGSKLNAYIPFLKEIKTIQDFTDYTFCQSLYILSKVNDISFDTLKYLKLSNKEVKLIKEFEKINIEFLKNTPLEIILYRYNIDDVIFVNNYYNYKKTTVIESCILAINSFNDIEITSQEIIRTINKNPGPWIKSITLKLEKEILLGRLNNNKKDILDFLSKLRDNI
ncbi:CCA tRNA nucleotidyltransferase [Gemella parahaemolysans]